MDDCITSPIIIVNFSKIMYYVYNNFKYFFYVVIFLNKVQFFNYVCFNPSILEKSYITKLTLSEF